MENSKSSSNLGQVWRYYDRTESRLGYRILLNSTKHFGWYEPGQSMWRFSVAMRQMEDVLGRNLGLPMDSAVLDAGCGVGNVARAMASRFGLKVTGIDILDFNLEAARRRSAAAGLGKRTEFQWGDYHTLDFADSSFDGAYTMETFVHSHDPERVLAEFFRVLRPGGRLIMFEYSRTPENELSAQANEVLQRVCTMAAMPAWLHLPHGELERLLDKSGFVVQSATDVTGRMLPMLRAFAIVGRVPYYVMRRLGKVEKAVNALSGVELYRHQEAWRYNIYVADKPAG